MAISQPTVVCKLRYVFFFLVRSLCLLLLRGLDKTEQAHTILFTLTGIENFVYLFYHAD